MSGKNSVKRVIKIIKVETIQGNHHINLSTVTVGMVQVDKELR